MCVIQQIEVTLLYDSFEPLKMSGKLLENSRRTGSLENAFVYAGKRENKGSRGKRVKESRSVRHLTTLNALGI